MSVSPRPSKSYRWEPTTPAGRVLGWLLVVAGAFSFLEAAIQLDRALSATNVTGSEPDVRLHMLRVLQSPLTLASSPVLVACGILWLVWQHKVHADLWARGAPGLRFTPGWAVGWWFVPFASLVQPFRSVRELSRHVGRTGTPGPGEPRAVSDGILSIWWASYLSYGVLSIPAYVIWFRALEPFFRGWATDETGTIATVQGSDLRAMAWWLCTSAIVRGAAALLAAHIVWTISRAEDAAAALIVVPPRPDL